MTTLADRLTRLLADGKFKGMADAAKAYRVPYQTYKKAMNGERPTLAPKWLWAISNYHSANLEWLMFDASPMRDQAVKVEGIISAGQQIVPIEDNDRYESAVLISDEAVAYEVRGDSMYPLAREGDIAYFAKHPAPPETLIGRECIVTLQDNRMFFKILERGDKPGRYNLESLNAPPIRDVEIVAAGEFLAVRRQRNRAIIKRTSRKPKA